MYKDIGAEFGVVLYHKVKCTVLVLFAGFGWVIVR